MLQGLKETARGTLNFLKPKNTASAQLCTVCTMQYTTSRGHEPPHKYPSPHTLAFVPIHCELTH